MPTVIKHLDGEALACIQSLAQSAFLDGECYAFAIALSRGLGWPIVGLMQGEVPRHAAVRSPIDHKLYDVRGAIRQDSTELGQPFGIESPYDLRKLAEADLRAVRQINERSIAMARTMAEAMWPAMPWIMTAADRMRGFADELEALSRKHKVWIRAPVPAQRPMLAKGEDDEAGYRLQLTDDAMAFTIDRYFKE